MTTDQESQQGGIGDAVTRQERACCVRADREAICHSKKLPPLTRLVLHTIACHMNDAGDPCLLSVATLCEETGLTAQIVKFHLKIAKIAGFKIDDIVPNMKRKTS